jgi:hypothetical protein
LGKKKEFFGTLVKFEKGKDEFNVDWKRRENN